MKKLLIFILALLPVFAVAKDDKKIDNTDPKYLSGAITMENGKVVFNKEIKVSSLKKNDLYNMMLDWANNRFQPEEPLYSKVVYTNEEKSEIVATAEEYIVFNSSALSLDRTRIYYYFLINVEDGKCKLNMSRIRYWYDENRDGGERFSAEEWITDEIALNKKQTKLAPICGKFRRETINLKDELFASVDNALGQYILQNNDNAQIKTTVNKVEPAISTGELREVGVTQLPTDLMQLVSNGRITITVGEEEIDVTPETWGGFGKLFNKDVAYAIIDKSRMAVNLMMENTDKYKISFYREGVTEPSVVVECKKTMSQKLSADELTSLNSNIDASKEYTMYIGEITKAFMR